MAVVGFAVRVMTTSSVEAVQGELLIVQRKVYVVPATPVNPEVGLEGVVIVPPAPDTMLLVTVPMVSVFSAIVAEVAHSV